ncbi:MAG: peptidoglycan DD-metalloendopeptidase family protein [Flavobacteriaceae bacterium]
MKSHLEQIIHEFSHESIHVISGVEDISNYAPLDLSINNTALQNFNITDANAFEGYIKSKLNAAKATVAYGGYNETRAIYSRSAHFYTENKFEERNIHLGLDLWCDANTPVLAALEGTVHSFKNNTNFGDYGPTIILKHHIQDMSFYALYGHLSLESLKDIKVGDKVAKGDVVGYLGDSSVNGDYAPHLHYQLIKNLEGNSGDFKGVTSLNDREKDLANCPDPNVLLKIY